MRNYPCVLLFAELICVAVCFDSTLKLVTPAVPRTMHTKVIKETECLYSAIISFPIQEFLLWLRQLSF